MPNKLPLYRILFFLSLTCTFLACQEDDPAIFNDPPEPGPQQYGTPFGNVPDIADIQMYEVNPRVYSQDQDLDGITVRLDSLKKLGINVIWLMPVFQTGTEKSVGSPYAVKDYLSIHSDYGTLEDLRELVDKAHALDMAVILDWVANHTAWDHEWIENRAWYVQNANGDIIHPPGTNWLDVAELNYNSSLMRREMIWAMKYWVLEANIDGYRCDYASGVPLDFWKQAIDTLRQITGRELIMFAESDDKSLLTTGFDLVFGWPFYGRLKDVFSGQSAQQLYAMHQNEYSGLAPGQHVLRWITNHDQHAWEATPQDVFGSSDASLAAFMLASHMGGVPLIYNGQEVAVPHQLPFFEGNQTHIPWDLNPGIKTIYEKVMNVRKNSPALRRGSITDFSTAHIVAFSRKEGDEEVLVLVNVRDSVQPFSLPAHLTQSVWYDVYDGSDVTLGTTVILDAYEYIVLAQ